MATVNGRGNDVTATQGSAGIAIGEGGRAKPAAGIVLFQPDADQVLALVATLRPSVGRVILFLNSHIAPPLRAALEAEPSVELIEARTNLGIGAALNLIVLAAAWRSYGRIILFDQDSKPAPETVARLSALADALQQAGVEPAVVAPRMVGATPDSKAPTYRVHYGVEPSTGAQPVDFVPTSGSLVDIATWRRVGPFRADYFIDGIDLEWSFRAWASGASCWIDPHLPMPHSVGAGTIRVPLLNRPMPNQRPFRMYCTVRNTIFGWRLPHVPFRWKLRQGAYLPLQLLAYAGHHGFDKAVLRMLLDGLRDGARGRLGVPPGAPDGTAPNG